MKHILRTIVFAAGVFAGTYSCVDQSPSAPFRSTLAPGSTRAAQRKSEVPPFAVREERAQGRENAWLVQCEQHPAFEGSGDIGPSGGQIIVGPHRLIIPPGALLEVVHITAVAPEGDNAFVSFEPSGLIFRKPAGLLLDAEGCDLSEYRAPDVVYLNDAGEVVERIEAVYSNHWKTVAAPISHFSGYAIAW